MLQTAVFYYKSINSVSKNSSWGISPEMSKAYIFLNQIKKPSILATLEVRETHVQSEG